MKMYSDKKRLYAVSAGLFILLFAALFVPYSSRILAAILLLTGAIVISLLVKKRSAHSTDKRTVHLLLGVIGVLYVVLLYLSGLHFGFHKAEQPFNLHTALQYVLPITVIIVTTEIIRNVLLAQGDKVADIFCYLSSVISQVLIFYNFFDVNNYFKFMDIIGMAFLPAIIASAVYNFLSRRFGMYPIITFRLITTLYPFLLPYEPAMPDSLEAFISLFVPLLVFAFINALYVPKRRFATHKKSRLVYVFGSVLFILMTSLVMLISCKFRYGALVIATESMTGELNKGDAVIFEQYDEQIVLEKQVIVFKKQGSLVVHRVDEIVRINGKNRYYTKGDANDSQDMGYVTDADIVGIAELKVPFVGYPTIWLNSLFS